MDDSDWIYTADKSDEYPNSIVHRRKEDSLAVWTYNKETGDIGLTIHLINHNTQYIDQTYNNDEIS